MDPRQVLRGSMRIIAFAPLAATALLACTPTSEPAESIPADEPVEAAAAPPQRPAASSTSSSFTLFESGQVRPLALSQDKQHLFAVNTPDNRLEVFGGNVDQLPGVVASQIGIESVQVYVRNEYKVWDVNHLD